MGSDGDKGVLNGRTRKRLLFFMHLSLYLSVLFVLSVVASGCQVFSTEQQQTVVLYTSVDQVFSEPLLQQFEEETGIEVLALYDAEASKTVGLVNRLAAEQSNPKADVFWNGEILQTLWLKEQGALASYKSPETAGLPENFVDTDNRWTAFGGRARVLIVNTDALTPDAYPHAILDLLEPRYTGNRIGLAYPVFGTTSTHTAALYAAWGRDDALRFFTSLEEKDIRIVDGNSVVRDLVADGRLSFGYTDTDDALSAINNGLPVAVVVPDQEDGGLGTLVIPNSVALIEGAPNPKNGRRLVDWLLSAATEEKLVQAGWIDIPSHSSIGGGYYSDLYGEIRGMQVDFEQVYRFLEESRQDMQALFIR